MINVAKRQKPMQGGVDGRRLRIQVKNAMIKQSNHFIFMVQAPVYFFERQQAVLVKGGATCFLNRTDITTKALYPHDLDGITSEWFFVNNFDRGLAPAIIR